MHPKLAKKVSAEHQAEIDRISAEFALNAKQTEALADYISRDGIEYVLEKAEIVRSEPRQNAARAFIAALRDDWKKPASIGVEEENRQKAEKAKERQEAARRKRNTLATSRRAGTTNCFARASKSNLEHHEKESG